MPFHDAHEVEMQLHRELYRGQWPEALARLDDWMMREPWRAEVLVRGALTVVDSLLRRDAENHRLHLMATRLYLRLGCGEEALSSANCALALAPLPEKSVARVHRAAACMVLKRLDRALADLASAVQHDPGTREMIRAEPSFHRLARHARYRELMGMDADGWWRRALRWLRAGPPAR